jgi:DNA polymerase elongation subunit (family B)
MSACAFADDVDDDDGDLSEPGEVESGDNVEEAPLDADRSCTSPGSSQQVQCTLHFAPPVFPEPVAAAPSLPPPLLLCRTGPDVDLDSDATLDTVPAGETAPGCCVLRFALLTVDVRDGVPIEYPLDAGANDTGLAAADVAQNHNQPPAGTDLGDGDDDAFATHDGVLGPEEGGAGGRRTDAALLAPCYAYLTGHTATGAKVGIVMRAWPMFQIEGPPVDAPLMDVQRHRMAIEKEVASTARWLFPSSGDGRRHPGDDLALDWHVACRFHGYEPSVGDPTVRRQFHVAQVTAPNREAARAAANMLRRRVTLPRAIDGKSPIHEDGIDAEQAFVDAQGLTPCGWHAVPWDCLRPVPPDRRRLLVHYEFDFDDAAAAPAAATPARDRWHAKVPPPVAWWAPAHTRRLFQALDGCTREPSLVVAAIDAEMTSGKAGRFPMPFRPEDAVVTVSIVLAFGGGDAPGRPAGAVFRRLALVLAAPGAVDPIPGVDVLHFGTEAALLAAVRDYLFVHYYVDVLAGHNIVTFDLKYLALRAGGVLPGERGLDGGGGGGGPTTTPGLPNRFLRFGALLGDVVQPKRKQLSSGGFGSNALVLMQGVGFVTVDSMLLCKLHPARLRSNTLKAASAFFLGPDVGKHDMPYEAIPVIVQGGTPAQWAALAGYCVQDSVLVMELLNKWKTVGDLVAQSRVINIPMATNVLCGQQQRVRNTLMRKARAFRPPMVMNGVNVRTPWSSSSGSGGGGGGAAAMTEEERVVADGGFVLDPRAGYYDWPVVVLDFASLYPSVQRSRNLCWSTVVSQATYESLSPEARTQLGIDTYETSTGTFHFATTVAGVFPRQLKDLLLARVAARKEGEAAEGAKAAALAAGDKEAAAAAAAAISNADARQRATKIVMNSGYGTANAQEGKGVMPCRAVGTVTCFVGASLNRVARAVVEASPFHATTLYGDTDSIMVAFPPPPGLEDPGDRRAILAHAFDQGMACQRAINALFDAREQEELRRRRVALEAAKAAAAAKGPGAGRGLVAVMDPEAATVLAAQHAVKVECEKVAYPFLLIAKKTYAYVEFAKMPTGDVPKDLGTLGAVKAKGLRVVKRDMVQFAKSLGSDLLGALLRHRSEAAFWRIVHDLVMRVCLGPREACGDPRALPLADFCFTKELKDGYEQQRPPPAHIAVVYGKEYAVPGSSHAVGDRVPYVLVSVPDLRRMHQPPWQVPGSGVPVPDAGSPPPLALDTGGVGVNDATQGAFARAPEEVLACPEDNVLNVAYYVETVCNMVGQIKPGAQTTASIAAIKRFAKAVAAAGKAARGPTARERARWAQMGFGAGTGAGAGAGAGAAATVLTVEHLMARYHIPRLVLPAPMPGAGPDGAAGFFWNASGRGKAEGCGSAVATSAVPVGFAAAAVVEAAPAAAAPLVDKDAPKVDVAPRGNKKTAAEKRKEAAAKKARVSVEADVLKRFLGGATKPKASAP